MDGFKVIYRNYGHWDIRNDSRRIFRLRGGPGKYLVLDERGDGRNLPTQEFKTVQACMSYICDLLMFELIVAEGQESIKIESWNV